MKDKKRSMYRVGQVVRYIKSGEFTTIVKVDSDGTLYESAGGGAFFRQFVTRINADDIRPLTAREYRGKA